MKEQEKILVSLCRDLARVDRAPYVATRYMELRRRRRVLNKAVRKVRRQCALSNPLWHVLFQPPLSIAGQTSSLVICHADGLSLKKIPIARQLDSKGFHRGTSIDDAREGLEVELGRDVSHSEVLGWYQEFMAWLPALLPEHPDPKCARLGRHVLAMREDLAIAEELLLAYARAQDETIFIAFMLSESLAQALAQIAEPSVVVAFHGSSAMVPLGQTSPVRLNGRYPVLTLWGQGCGLCVLRTDDLRAMVGPAGTVVTINCDKSGWSGSTEEALVAIQEFSQLHEVEGQRFEYFGRTADQEA
jgi:hypothetical protein